MTAHGREVSSDVVSVIVGPDEHGVTRHAGAVAAATGVRVARHTDWTGAVEASCRRASVVHWHFTDRLFGDDVATAAGHFAALAAPLSVRHVVSLHDVPAGGRSTRQARRVAAYRRVAALADVVVVASDHEHRRLLRAGVDAPVVVIPLPVLPLGEKTGAGAPPARRHGRCRAVGVLGFVYPGKGHGEVIAATAGLPDDVEVVALGCASPGHDELVRCLRVAAATAGRSFRLTGFLDDEALAGAAATVAVPVVAARAVSASASLGTWLSAGRRPIAVRNGFVAELAARDPELVTICEPDELGAAIRRGLAEPRSTWRTSPVPRELTMDAVAGAHRSLYERLRG